MSTAVARRGSTGKGGGDSTGSAVTSAGLGMGGAALATAAAACCAGPTISPLIVAVLGAGGAAWAAGLKPYATWMLAASGGLVAYSLWASWPSRDETCALGGRRSRLRLMTRGVSWVAAFVWLAGLALNLLLR